MTSSRKTTTSATSDVLPEGQYRFGDPVVLTCSIGFILLFVGLSLFDLEGVAQAISAGFAWTARTLGSYFQILLLII